jgi:hypothetical protein
MLPGVITKAVAQDGEELPVPKSKAPERAYVMTYVRVVVDNNGNVRTDENVVPNFKINKLLRVELGLRHGQNAERFNAYYHYKVELQTRLLLNTFRFFGRMSDNVVEFPYPSYRRTNIVFVGEARRSIGSKVVVLAGGGYVISHQQNNSTDALPLVNLGTKNNYGVWKATFRYRFRKEMFAECTWGSYDVFNPYIPKTPFLQTLAEAKLNHLVDFFCYYRYQYDRSPDKPLNHFFSAGIRLHL